MSSNLRATVNLIEASNPEAAHTLSALHALLFTPGWTSDDFASLLANPGSVALLAEWGSERLPIGFILGRVVVDEAEILSIGVLPNAQRQGVGTHLISELARLAAERGATRLFLEVAEGNMAARQLYRAQGFGIVGRRPGYYEHPSEAPADALILSKRIGR